MSLSLPALRGLRARVIALFLASVMCAGASGIGHAAWDDPSCDPIPVQHDHSAHRFQSSRPFNAPADDHCVLCHSQRSLRAGLVAARATIGSSDRVATLSEVACVLTTGVPDTTTPSRGPPASLL